MPLHPLKSFELQKYYQNEPKFNGVYSRNNLPNIRDEAYVIKLDGFKLQVNRSSLDSFVC